MTTENVDQHVVEPWPELPRSPNGLSELTEADRESPRSACRSSASDPVSVAMQMPRPICTSFKRRWVWARACLDLMNTRVVRAHSGE